MTFELDYERMVDDLNDNAFKICVDALYPLCDFKILKKEHIRKIDLLEMIHRLCDDIDKERENYFTYFLRLYMRDYIECKQGSRAEKYKNKAFELISSIDSCKQDININEVDSMICDIFITYISLFRERSKRSNPLEVFAIIENLSFTVAPEDLELPKTILQEKLIPLEVCKIREKDGKFYLIGNEQNKRVYLYTVSILYLAVILQEQGML